MKNRIGTVILVIAIMVGAITTAAYAKSIGSLFKPRVLACTPGAYKTSTVTDQCYESNGVTYCCNGIGTETSKCSVDGVWELNSATCAADGGFTQMGGGAAEVQTR